MALTIAAFMLLGIVMMNFRSLNFENEEVLDTNEYTQKAIAIGRSLIEEIQEKPFDAVLNTKKIVKLEDLTACGPGSWESYPDNFNDMDDFHRQVFTSPELGDSLTTATPQCLRGTWGYTVRCDVRYVQDSNPTVSSYSRTWSKLVTLVITNEFSDEPVTMSYLATH
ncbi:MAG: hypothetical protein C0600_15670 [Ignavibacteria bacterium]|nr:MAG: hypothetical protein C0600_15670 [Ignavibacteria bacterium]